MLLDSPSAHEGGDCCCVRQELLPSAAPGVGVRECPCGSAHVVIGSKAVVKGVLFRQQWRVHCGMLYGYGTAAVCKDREDGARAHTCGRRVCGQRKAEIPHPELCSRAG